MRFQFATALAVFCVAGTASAIDITFLPGSNADNRFIDNFSDAYAQVGLSPEGMYNLTTDAPLGAVDAFPLDDVWNNFNQLVLSGFVTDSTTGTFDIIGTNGFDFDQVVDGDKVSIYANFGAPFYTTTLLPDAGTNATNFGTVTLTGGTVTSLDFDADVIFAFGGFAPYQGSLSVTETGFDLLVSDGFQPSDQSPNIVQTWDFSGGVSFVVPEPGVGALVLLGSLAAFRRRSA